MNTLATQLHPAKYFIEVIQGPEKGASYELFSTEIRIGREETNDIILVDSKCSRDHAIITIQNSIYYIEDLKSQNGTLVDGQKITKVLLKSGSEIQIGSTVLKFKVIHDIPKALPDAHSFLKNSSSNSSSGTSNKKIKFYGIIGTIVILFLFILNTPSMNSQQTTVSTIDDEILASQKRQESILKNQNLENLNSRQYLDAQASYMKGLRDYREGFYKSAFVSFNAAIAIYPEHKLARRYLRLSQNKLDEQVQVLMNEGNVAMEENKYQLAQSAFKNVLVLINDPENKLYKEAKEKLNECNLMLRESF